MVPDCDWDRMDELLGWLDRASWGRAADLCREGDELPAARLSQVQVDGLKAALPERFTLERDAYSDEEQIWVVVDVYEREALALHDAPVDDGLGDDWDDHHEMAVL